MNNTEILFEIKRILNNITINIKIYLYGKSQTIKLKALSDINIDIEKLNNIINNELIHFAESVEPALTLQANKYYFEHNIEQRLILQIKSLIDLLANDI